MSLNIRLYAFDKGPTESLERLARHLEEMGHRVKTALFQIALDNSEMDAFLDDADVLVCGIGTKPPGPSIELELCRRILAQGKPVLWFADIYHVWQRKPHFGTIWPTSIATPDEFEATAARNAGYPHVVATGIPLWEDLADMTLPWKARTELGADIDSRIIVWFSTKMHEMNQRTIEDLFYGTDGLGCEFLFAFHPGDEAAKENRYDDLLEHCPGKLLDAKGVRTEFLVSISDVLFQSFSTAGIAAVYQRRPVISYLPMYARDRMEEIFGRREWPPAERGVNLLVPGREAIRAAVEHLLTEEGRSAIRVKQAELYPLLRKGEAVRKLAAEIAFLTAR